MKQIIKIGVIFFLIAGTMLSCSRQTDTNISELDKQFSTAIPLADINKSLQIVVDSKETSFESGSDISLLVYNKSDHSIYFDNDSYVRLLLSLDHLQWLQIENGITYFGTTLASPQHTPLLDFVHTVVRPILDQTTVDAGNKDILLRIVIIGEIMDGDIRTGQTIGAYVDVVLEP